MSTFSRDKRSLLVEQLEPRLSLNACAPTVDESPIPAIVFLQAVELPPPGTAEVDQFARSARMDVNLDGRVTARDALNVANALIASNDTDAQYDVNGDGRVSALDALQMILPASALHIPTWISLSLLRRREKCPST